MVGKSKNVPNYLRDQPAAAKVPRVREGRSTDEETPSWMVTMMDVQGPQWGWKGIPQSHLWDTLHDKLKSFESMTWAEIEQRKSCCNVPIQSLVTGARKRLKELKLDEAGELFHLRLGGKPRLWGIREGSVFKILWWDPEHEVCPSPLKHT